jgi:hypothetical protein
MLKGMLNQLGIVCFQSWIDKGNKENKLKRMKKRKMNLQDSKSNHLFK